MSERQIIHIDMDAFFASVEQRDDPSLRGKPVVVGGPSMRAVVTAASYEARPFGIHSAQPMAEALRRCPDLIVVSGRHSYYGDISNEVFEIFRRFTPLVEGLSIDEAFLDVTESRALFGDGEAIARQIRAAIRDELELTASAGVAPSKFVAKIASDLDKPDGLTVVGEDVVAFLAPLPIERMWGVGPKAAKRLHEVGLQTIGDLAAADPEDLEGLLGIWGQQVHRLARGQDPRPVQPSRAAKSIGAESTFGHDISDRSELERNLLSQSGRVARRLFAKGLYGSVITVKVKFRDFDQRTRQLHLSEPVCDTDSIYEAACQLLDRFALHKSVRLTGVSVGGLTTMPVQQSLFGREQKKKRQEIERVSAAIRSRFGHTGLTRATLLEDDS